MSCKTLDYADCPTCGPKYLHDKGFCRGCGRSRFFFGPVLQPIYNNKRRKANNKLRGIDRL